MQTTFREKEPRIGDRLSLYSCSFRGNIDLDSYMKKKTDTGVFLEFFEKFSEQLFCRTLPGDSLCTVLQKKCSLGSIYLKLKSTFQIWSQKFSF